MVSAWSQRPGDIGTVAGCESAVKTANDAFGGLDILVNSAGIGAGRPIEDCDEAMSDDHVDVNLKGTFFCCRAALSALRESNGQYRQHRLGCRPDGGGRAHCILCVKGRGRQHDPLHGVGNRARRTGQLHMPGLCGYRHDPPRLYRQE